MKLDKITLWIGIFIFGSLFFQTFSQLQKYEWGVKLEALIFIAISAIFYFVCALLYQNNAQKWGLLLLFVVGAAGVVLIFAGPYLFAVH